MIQDEHGDTSSTLERMIISKEADVARAEEGLAHRRAGLRTLYKASLPRWRSELAQMRREHAKLRKS